jgi:hypothetical protein
MTRDGAALDMLIMDYDHKFALAYPDKFRKFKHHAIKHLRKHLELFGPFRNYSCLSGEDVALVATLTHATDTFSSCCCSTTPCTLRTEPPG